MSKQLTPVDELKQTLSQPTMKDQFRAALPPHINVDKFVRVITTAIAQTPALVNADRNSFFAACMKSAADGLIPDGRDAAIVTFGNTCTYMPMVSGILKKIRNSGELSSIASQLVFEKDNFKYWVDADGEHVQHYPDVFGDRGEPIGVYALAKTKDGGVYVEILNKKDIEAIQKSSRASNGPWKSEFKHEMWKKSSIRRLSKRLPMSTDLESTLQTDDELFLPEKIIQETAPKIEAPKDVTPKQKQSRLAKAIEKTEAQPEIEQAPTETYEDLV